tara:strand:- start:326 stop:439 length:114 start_codon:yes stop_codon:yes gene_type:complete
MIRLAFGISEELDEQFFPQNSVDIKHSNQVPNISIQK